MADEAPAAALVRALGALDTLGIARAITGSFAMAAHGFHRHTQDANVKILVDESGDHEEPLALEMGRTDFSRIDEHTFQSGDGFVVEYYPVRGRMDEEAFDRRQALDALPSYGGPVDVVTVEDLILAKLREFNLYASYIHIQDVQALTVMHRKTLDIEFVEGRVRRYGLEAAWARVVPDED